MDISEFILEDLTLDVAKILATIWDNKINRHPTTAQSSHIHHLVNIIVIALKEKSVYLDVEKFLPQIAHMTIHSSQQCFKAMEMLICAISKFSMHSALTLTYSMIAAMEDYQPENSSGTRNPFSENLLFQRCTQLLQIIERCVIDKEFICSVEKELVLISKVGWLYYKRSYRLSVCSRKGWKRRYFSVLNGVLMCYKDDTYSLLKRAMPLLDCIVQVVQNKKHGNYFEVFSAAAGTRYQLYAESSSEMYSWVSILQWESDRMKPLQSIDSGENLGGKINSDAAELDAVELDAVELDDSLEHRTGPGKTMQFITQSFRRVSVSGDPSIGTFEGEQRIMFFRNQTNFIRQITDVCERLRFIERPLRKAELRREMTLIKIPKFCYLPICSAADPWNHVIRALPEESYAFSTKARCPSLVFFECETFPDTLNVRSTKGRGPADVISVVEFISSELFKKYGSSISPLSSSGSLSELDQKIPNAPFLLSDAFLPRTSVWMSTSEATEKLRLEGYTMEHGALSTSLKSVNLDFQDEFDDVSLTDAQDEMWGETFALKRLRIRKASINSNQLGWELRGMIAKSNDDLRQEVFVMQLISLFKDIFHEEKVKVWTFPYKILSTSKSTGLIELIPDASSLDGLKKMPMWPGSLASFFKNFFGRTNSPCNLATAQQNYVESMASYSIIAYLLAIKDRHNGNIMMNNTGHIIHIDFGFVFGLAPGKQFSMEKAPWKMTDEMLEVMGGTTTQLAKDYLKLCTQAFIAVRKHAKVLLVLVDIMAYRSNFPSFRYNKNALNDFESRLLLDVPDSQLEAEVEKLFLSCIGNLGTNLYDQFQLLTNGIKP